MTDTPESFTGAKAAEPTARGTTEDRDKTKRDGHGRYLLPHLDGRPAVATQGMTRVSTNKSALSNTIGIQKWTNRLTAEGVATDPEIMTEIAKLVATKTPDERKSAVTKLAERAQVKAGSKDRSNLGTAVHLHHERKTKGEDPGSVPTEHARDISAYDQLMAEQQVTLIPELSERTVKCRYGAAGTFDNIVWWWNPDTEEYELVIADLKTGRDLELGWLEILIQLWFYANAEAMWVRVESEPNGGHYVPMPSDLRKDRALVFHTPMNGTAELFVLDLSGVETYVEAAITARRANSEAKHKVRSLGTVDLRGPAFVGQAPVPDQANAKAHYTAAEIDAFTAAGQGYPQADYIRTTPDQVADFVATGIPPAQAETSTYGLNPYDYPTKEAFTEAVRAAKYQAEGWTPEPGPIMATVARIEDQAEADKPMSPAVRVRPEPERDPVTGRKKRTCGFCHNPGHTQKNCPSNPASDKYVPVHEQPANSDPDPVPETVGDPARFPGQVTGAELDAEMSDGDHDTRASAVKAVVGRMMAVPGAELVDSGLPTGPEHAQHQPPPVTPPVGPEPEPGTYCPGNCTGGWASNGTNWVCAGHGLPSKAEASRMLALSRSNVPADPVMVAITEAAASQAVLSIRTYYMNTGEWSPDHDRYAQARYNGLHQQGL